MGRKRKRSWKTNNWAMFEPLERRQLCSVVNVDPGNYRAAIQSSNAGDTINFAAGNYAVQGPVNIPSNRTFVGNGAVLNGDGSAKDQICFDNSSNIDFSGFVLNGVNANANGTSGLKFHNNTLENSPNGGFGEDGMQNSQVNNNIFTHISGLSGFPQSNDTFDNNRFDYCWEPIHLVGFEDVENTDVSGNVITHTTRFGIELQGELNNLTVNNNWLGDWEQNTGSGHMGLSIATAEATNVMISGNVILLTGDDGGDNWHWTCAAIEAMGTNVTIQNNLAWNWNCFVLDGLTGANVVKNNNVYGGAEWGVDGGYTEAPTDSDGAVQPISAYIPASNPAAGVDPGASATGSSAVVRPAETQTITTAAAATTTKTAKVKKMKKKAAAKKKPTTAKTNPDPILKSIVRIGA